LGSLSLELGVGGCNYKRARKRLTKKENPSLSILPSRSFEK
jgi:hypothetical protein